MFFQNESEASEDYELCCNDVNEAYMVDDVGSAHEQNQISEPLSDVITTLVLNVTNKIQNSLPAIQAKPLMTVHV